MERINEKQIKLGESSKRMDEFSGLLGLPKREPLFSKNVGEGRDPEECYDLC